MSSQRRGDSQGRKAMESFNELTLTFRVKDWFQKRPLEDGPPSTLTSGHIKANARAVLFSLLNNPSHAIVSTDERGTIIQWNQAAQRFFGYESAEVIGISSQVLFSQKFRARAGKMRFEVTDGIPDLFKGSSVELQGLRKDGSTFPIELSVTSWSGNEHSLSGGFTAVIQDITERKKDAVRIKEATTQLETTLAILMDSEARWKAIVENSQDMIMVTSAEGENEGRITYLSPSCQSILGYPPEELVGLTWFSDPDKGQNPIHPDDLDSVKREYYRVLSGMSVTNHQFRIRTAIGEERWVSHSSSPIMDENGDVKDIVSIVRDITEEKKAVKADLLHMKLETARTTAGGVAHDFNNVLTKITSGISFAISGLSRIGNGPVIDMAKEYLQRASQEAHHGADLVAQLTSFAKGTVLQKMPIYLNDPVMGAIRSCCDGDQIELRVDLPDELPSVEADHTQIKQVMINLLSNAIQAMPKGGAIEVTGSETFIEEQEQTIPPGHYVRISIRDQGVGIAPENLSRIFEFSYTTKEEGNGHGIGLAISSQIIKEHGGTINVESELGKGTEFHIYLPVSRS